MLQEIMGHASITTTLDLYGHLYPGEMDCYVARLDDAAGRVSAGQADAAKMRQMTRTLTQARKTQRADQRKLWRARRDSNPQPSEP